jgi:hypothetical protein
MDVGVVGRVFPKLEANNSTSRPGGQHFVLTQH